MYTDWLLKMKENEAQTTLEERVVELLAEHKMTVTTAGILHRRPDRSNTGECSRGI